MTEKLIYPSFLYRFAGILPLKDTPFKIHDFEAGIHQNTGSLQTSATGPAIHQCLFGRIKQVHGFRLKVRAFHINVQCTTNVPAIIFTLRADIHQLHSD